VYSGVNTCVCVCVCVSRLLYKGLHKGVQIDSFTKGVKTDSFTKESELLCTPERSPTPS
jgi:hypothetical protein